MNGPIFSVGPPDNACNLLEGACSVGQFLADVSCVYDENNPMQLSDRGYLGLNQILNGLVSTMDAAAEKL